MSNKVYVCGLVKSYEFSHEINGEQFYEVILTCTRLSGMVDKIPTLISNRIYSFTKDDIGQCVQVTGELRSYNLNDTYKRKLILHVFCEEVYFLDSEYNVNEITIKGYLCRDPIYRSTPNGRLITDIFIASNRSYGKTDYIPCVTWGRNASYSSGLKTGDLIELSGRIQSRVYFKDDIEHTVYEVSVSTIELIEDPYAGDDF